MDIIDNEKNYTIDKNGTIYSKIKNKIRKQQETIHGYKSIDLISDGIRKKYPVHRLVAIHFIPNPKNKPCVNHIDGNKHNNNVSNLEWVTYSENEKHSFEKLGKKAHNSKITMIKNIKTGKEDIFESLNKACEFTGAIPVNAGKVITGKRKSAAGFTYRYM